MRCDMIWRIFVLALVFVASASAAPCTPSTCPEGPVIARFEYSNCTGEVTYEAYTSVWNECEHESWTMLNVQTETEIRHYTLYSPSCDVISPEGLYSMYGYTFGICTDLLITNPARSAQDFDGIDLAKLNILNRLSIGLHQRETMANIGVMMLPSVNAAYKMPQAVFQYNASIPLFYDTPVDCPIANNCTLPNGGGFPEYSFTRYDSASCQGKAHSSMLPNIDFAHGCYNRQNTSYYRMLCHNTHSYGAETHTLDDCSDTPALFSSLQSTCRQYSYFDVQCTAGITPESPEAPSLPYTPDTTSSSANAFQGGVFSAILGFFILIAL